MLALHTVFNRLAFLESRRLVLAIPENVLKLWNNWEIRVLVLVSLTLQLCLLHFGCRRRYSAKTWLSAFLWLSYLGADSVATVALGVISNNQGNCVDAQLQNELIAFWAPFLLLHLGGQDTITAYAVQDNELWLRHFLGLVVQTGVAVYIVLLSWKVSWLSFLTIPLILVGFIKYAERTWVLRAANIDISSRPCWNVNMMLALGHAISGHEPTSRKIKNGIFLFFKVVRCLFLNQKANIPSRELRYSGFCDSKSAWNMVEGELGYAYDVYYTKAPLFFTTWGFLIRTFSFTSILFVFVIFLIKESHKHPFVDLVVTYLLLVGAILMEIYGVVLLCASDWPLQRCGIGLLDNCVEALLTHIISGCAKLTSKQRWSNSMCQLDLLGLCLDVAFLQVGDGTPSLSSKIRGWALSILSGDPEVLFYMTHKQVSAELKDFVFSSFLPERGWDSNGFPERYNNYITNGTESIETYQSIIIWHIATDLCFHTDCGRDESNLRRAVSKDLSDYMMYILVMLPQVLSTGNAKRVFRSTYGAAWSVFNEEMVANRSRVQALERLISRGFGSDASVYLCLSQERLFWLGIGLAQKLNGELGMWEILSSFWCDSLVYVATVCQGSSHAQLLRNGGEFLTHVWLLDEHFNLSVRARRAAAEAENTAVRNRMVYYPDWVEVEEEVRSFVGR